MSIEFNGDIKFNKTDAGGTSNLKKTGTANNNSTQIGDLLRSKDNANTDFIIGLDNKPEYKVIDLDDLSKYKLPGFEETKEEPKKELTPEQKEALGKLNEKVSSTGISYSDANNTINEIREKYNDDKYYKVVEEIVDPNKDESKDGMRNYIYYTPFKIRYKEFDVSKLPEPDKTKYLEAIEAKKEIENNNGSLAKEAGIEPPGREKPPVAGKDMSEMAKIAEKFFGKPDKPELTEKQKAARSKLDEKQSSTGVKYKDAKAVIAQLTEKYKDSCRSEFESKQPTGILIYIMPYEAFDPYKIPEPDKTAYFDALAVITEIEQQNSALLQQAGLSMTPQPNTDYAGVKGRKLY